MRGRKRPLFMMFLVFITCFFLGIGFYGAQTYGEDGILFEESGEGEGWEKELSFYDFSEIERVMQESLGGPKQSFSEVVWKLIDGNFAEFWDLFWDYVWEALWGELRTGRALAWQVFLIALAGAVFTNMSRAFNESPISQGSFYVMYMALSILLFTGFQMAVSTTAEAFALLGRVMSAFLPVFFVAVAVQGQLTAAVMYEFTMVLIRGVQWVFEHVVLLGVRGFVVLQILEGIMPEPFLGRLAGLIKKSVVWIVKTGFGAVIGFQIVQGLLLPSMDSVKGGMLLRLAKAIPGLGGGVEAAAQMVFGTAALVRNGIGLAGLLVLFAASLGPLIKLGFLTFLYRALAAVLQPVSDKRLLAAIDVAGDASRLLLRTLWSGILLFAVAVGVACACLGG